MLELLVFASTPFFPQNFNVELIATWSDGDDSTAAVDVEVKDGWVYLAVAGKPYWFTGEKLCALRFEEDNSQLTLTYEEELGVQQIGEMVVNGDYLYVFPSGRVYDLSDPSHPNYLRNFETGAKSTAKGLSGRGIIFNLPQGTYLAWWLFIYSLERPDSPAVIYKTVVDSAFWSGPIAFLPPKYLYAFTYDDSIAVVDLSDPRNPRLLNKIPGSYYSSSGTLWFDQDSTPYLVIGTWAIAKIFVYSLIYPEKPYLVKTINAGSEMITAHGPRIYSTDMDLSVFENLDSLVGYYDFQGASREVLFYKNLLYVPARTLGLPNQPDLYIFHYLGDTFRTDTPDTPRLDTLPELPPLQFWFSRGKLFFKAPEALELNLKVYDSRGSLIFQENLNIPKGRSSKPLELPSKGVYFAVVEGKGKERRVVKCYY